MLVDHTEGPHPCMHSYVRTLLAAMAVVTLAPWGCAVGLPHVREWPAQLLAPAAGPTRAAPSDGASASRPAWLSDSQWQTVLAGDLVTQPITFSIRSGDYIGGVAVMFVHAPPDVVGNYISDVSTLPKWLPLTKRAAYIGKAGCDVTIELEQGLDIYSRTYSIHAFRVGNMVQWRLDPSRPHDIDDLWGYFRARPFKGGTLLIMGITADLRMGPAAVIFEDRVLQRLLQLPNDVRLGVEGYVIGLPQRAAAGQLPCVLPAP